MAERVTNISDEMLAAFLDGNTTARETQSVLDAVASDDGLQEFLSLSLQVDEAMSGIDLDLSLSKNRPFPVHEMAWNDSSSDLLDSQRNHNKPHPVGFYEASVDKDTVE